ncbi:MAG: type II toxin-antitoxin system RelE family toxin [Geminicoccaceae bacterium]
MKRLGRLPRNRRQQIRAKLQALAADPTGPQPQAKPLKGEPGTFRLRIGEWRTTYDLDQTAWPAC